MFHFFHLLQLFPTSVAFSLGTSMGTGKRGPWVIGPWPPGAFVWPCLSSSPWLSYISSGPGLLSLVPPPRHLHLLRRPPLPLSLHRLLHHPRPIPASCPLSGPAVAAAAFSCLASLLCITDVAWTWVYYVFKDIPSSIHTVPGLRKVLEAFVACIIFAFLSNTSLYLHQPALEWPLLHLLHPSSRGHATEAG